MRTGTMRKRIGKVIKAKIIREAGQYLVQDLNPTETDLAPQYVDDHPC